MGLVSAAVPKEDLWKTVLEKAQKMMQKGPLALKLAKMVIHQGYDADMKTALLLEKYAQAILFATDDKREGTTAFLEKRAPHFKGR
jgi:enoyl-CoA hydratase